MRLKHGAIIAVGVAIIIIIVIVNANTPCGALDELRFKRIPKLGPRHIPSAYPQSNQKGTVSFTEDLWTDVGPKRTKEIQPPRHLRVGINDGNVLLTWESECGVKCSYNVYRRSCGEPYYLRGRYFKRYSEALPANATVYSYRVTADNQQGKQSYPSEQVWLSVP